MATPQIGDFVRYRRAEPRPFHRDPETPAFEWVDDYGLVLEARSFRPARPDKDYLIKVYFPTHPTSPIRTLRASKIAEVL